MNLFRRIFFLGVIAMSFFACASDDDGTENKSSINQQDFLQNSSKIISESFSDLEASTTQLETLAIDFRNASAAAISLSQLQELKDQLRLAWKDWQKASAYEFGVLEPFSLKSNVNLYRTDTAKVERNIADENYNFDQLTIKDAKGFPALDYLLNNGIESVILAQLSNDSSRRVYVERLASDISSRVKEARTAWENNKQSFESNEGTDVGSSTGMLVNAFNLHYERFFRNNKIGIPLGVRSSGIAQVDFVESFYGGYSLELAQESFAAIKNFYLGIDGNKANGFGLEDYLIAIEASDLDQRIKDQITSIEVKMNVLSDPFSAQISNDAAKVQEAYNEIQKLVVLLKVDMPSRMGVLITFQDNDGD